jgi:hypothetical protein
MVLAKGCRQSSRRRFSRPAVELLEDRTVLSSGHGSGGLLDGRLRDDAGPGEVAALERAVGEARGLDHGGSGGDGSFSSGPGYPLPPAAGPALRGEVATRRAQTEMPVAVMDSTVAVVPVLLAGANPDGQGGTLPALTATPTVSDVPMDNLASAALTGPAFSAVTPLTGSPAQPGPAARLAAEGAAAAAGLAPVAGGTPGRTRSDAAGRDRTQVVLLPEGALQSGARQTTAAGVVLSGGGALGAAVPPLAVNPLPTAGPPASAVTLGGGSDPGRNDEGDLPQASSDRAPTLDPPAVVAPQQPLPAGATPEAVPVPAGPAETVGGDNSRQPSAVPVAAWVTENAPWVFLATLVVACGGYLAARSRGRGTASEVQRPTLGRPER